MSFQNVDQLMNICEQKYMKEFSFKDLGIIPYINTKECYTPSPNKYSYDWVSNLSTEGDQNTIFQATILRSTQYGEEGVFWAIGISAKEEDREHEAEHDHSVVYINIGKSRTYQSQSSYIHAR